MEIVAYNPRQHVQQQIPASGLSVGSDDSAVDIEIRDERLSGFQFVVHLKDRKHRGKVVIVPAQNLGQLDRLVPLMGD